MYASPIKRKGSRRRELKVQEFSQDEYYNASKTPTTNFEEKQSKIKPMAQGNGAISLDSFGIQHYEGQSSKEEPQEFDKTIKRGNMALAPVFGNDSSIAQQLQRDSTPNNNRVRNSSFQLITKSPKKGYGDTSRSQMSSRTLLDKFMMRSNNKAPKTHIEEHSPETKALSGMTLIDKFGIQGSRKQDSKEQLKPSNFIPVQSEKDLNSLNNQIVELRVKNEQLSQDNDNLINENYRLRANLKGDDSTSLISNTDILRQLDNKNKALVEEIRHLKQNNGNGSQALVNQLEIVKFLLGVEITRLVGLIKDYDSSLEEKAKLLKQQKREIEELRKQLSSNNHYYYGKEKKTSHTEYRIKEREDVGDIRKIEEQLRRTISRFEKEKELNYQLDQENRRLKTEIAEISYQNPHNEHLLRQIAEITYKYNDLARKEADRIDRKDSVQLEKLLDKKIKEITEKINSSNSNLTYPKSSNRIYTFNDNETERLRVELSNAKNRILELERRVNNDSLSPQTRKPYRNYPHSNNQEGSPLSPSPSSVRNMNDYIEEERIENINGRPTKVRYRKWIGTPTSSTQPQKLYSEEKRSYPPTPGKSGEDEVLKKKAKDLERINKKLQEDLESVLSRKEVMREELEKLAELLNERENELERLRLSDRDHTQNLSIQKLNEQYERKVDENNSLRKVIEDLNNEIGNLRNIAGVDHKSTEQRFSQNINRLEEAILELQEENSHLKNSVASLKEELSLVDKEVEYKNNLLSKLKGEYEHERTKLQNEKQQKESKIQELENSINNLNSRMEEFKGSSEEINTLKMQLNQKTQQFTDQIEKNSELGENLREMEDEMNYWKSKFQDLERNMNSERNNFNESQGKLELTIAKLEIELSATREKIQSLSLNKVNEELRIKQIEDNSFLRGENQALRGQIEYITSERNRLDKKIESLDLIIQELRESILDKESKLSNAEAVIKRLGNEKAESEKSTIQDQTNTIENLKEQLSSLKYQIEKNENDESSKLQENRRVIDKLKEQLTEQKNITVQKTEDNKILLEKLDQAHTKLENFEKKLNELNSQINDSRDSGNGMIANYEEEIAHLENQLDENGLELTMIKGQLADLLEENNRLRHGTRIPDERFKREKEDLEKSQEELVDKIVHLKNAIKERDARIESLETSFNGKKLPIDQTKTLKAILNLVRRLGKELQDIRINLAEEENLVNKRIFQILNHFASDLSVVKKTSLKKDNNEMGELNKLRRRENELLDELERMENVLRLTKEKSKDFEGEINRLQQSIHEKDLEIDRMQEYLEKNNIETIKMALVSRDEEIIQLNQIRLNLEQENYELNEAIEEAGKYSSLESQIDVLQDKLTDICAENRTLKKDLKEAQNLLRNTKSLHNSESSDQGDAVEKLKKKVLFLESKIKMMLAMEPEQSQKMVSKIDIVLTPSKILGNKENNSTCSHCNSSYKNQISSLKMKYDQLLCEYEEKCDLIEKNSNRNSQKSQENDKVKLVRGKIEMILCKIIKFINDLKHLENELMSSERKNEIFHSMFIKISKEYENLNKKYVNECIELCHRSITVFEDIQQNLLIKKAQSHQSN